MTIKQARDLLGENYKDFSDETILSLIELIEALCIFTIQTTTETNKD